MKFIIVTLHPQGWPTCASIPAREDRTDAQIMSSARGERQASEIVYGC